MYLFDVIFLLRLSVIESQQLYQLYQILCAEPLYLYTTPLVDFKASIFLNKGFNK